MEIVSEKRGTLGEEGVRGFSNRKKPLEGSEKAYSIRVAIKTSGFLFCPRAAIPSENSPFFAGLALFWKKKTAWRTCSPYPNLLGPFRPHTKPSYPPCHFAPKRQTRSRDT